MKVHLGVVAWIYKALVLVSPYDKVQEFGKEIFRKVASLGICMTIALLDLKSCCTKLESNALILVNTHQVEPILLLSSRLEELYFTITKCSKQSLIPHITHTVKSQFGLTFL